ncbi:hypothetical protein DPV78_003776 [Talaromyces pinophilus]|nr:hypothetical protein DPV78_003776 [Talaromyces pinophilus]
MSAPSLLFLPTDIIFHIFKRLGRPTKLALALTCPLMLALFTNFLDMDRYRFDPDVRTKFRFLEDISWDDPQGQAVTLRFLALADMDGINSDPSSPVIGESWTVHSVEEADARENFTVVSAISGWLRTRLQIEGGCIVCVECGRHILRREPDGTETNWMDVQSNRHLYVLLPTIDE